MNRECTGPRTHGNTSVVQSVAQSVGLKRRSAAVPAAADPRKMRIPVLARASRRWLADTTTCKTWNHSIPKRASPERTSPGGSRSSSATVSRALRDDARITEAVRQEVRQAAVELGYRPDPMLTALAHYRRRKVEPAISACLARHSMNRETERLWAENS